MSLPEVEFKYHRVLFMSGRKMGREIERRIREASAMMRKLKQSAVVKRDLSQKAKLSSYR